MKPLSHLTVLDLTVNVPGPFCSMTLGDLGARVITVEPLSGDPLRHSLGMWSALNRGKESISLDLKAETGRGVLHRMVASADVVLEGWRPGVAERLGADYAALSGTSPGLVYCSISGFGQEGPWRDRSGHDVNYLALGGYLGVQSSMEGRPWPPALLLSDLAAGMYAAISVIAAVSGRQDRGEGAYIDLSMTETVLSLLGPEIGRSLEDGTDGSPNVSGIPHYGLFECADGRWLSLGIVHEDHFWARFCAKTGLDHLAELRFEERLAQAESIELAVSEALRTRAANEWEALLVDADVPAAAVATLDQTLKSPQFAFRSALAGLGRHMFASFPARFSTGSVAPTGSPPRLGEHSEALLREHGYDQEQADQLIESGAVGSPAARVTS